MKNILLVKTMYYSYKPTTRVPCTESHNVVNTGAQLQARLALVQKIHASVWEIY